MATRREYSRNTIYGEKKVDIPIYWASKEISRGSKVVAFHSRAGLSTGNGGLSTGGGSKNFPLWRVA
jgi:hypothetical protein